MRARSDVRDIGGNVQQQPVKEVHARQGGRNLAALLVHIVAPAGHIRVMADDNKRLRARWHIAPGQMRVPVGRQGHMGCRIRHRKREFTRNGLAVLKTLADKLHGNPSCSGLG
jgi:hypothetical protein